MQSAVQAEPPVTQVEMIELQPMGQAPGIQAPEEELGEDDSEPVVRIEGMPADDASSSTSCWRRCSRRSLKQCALFARSNLLLILLMIGLCAGISLGAG